MPRISCGKWASVQEYGTGRNAGIPGPCGAFRYRSLGTSCKKSGPPCLRSRASGLELSRQRGGSRAGLTRRSSAIRNLALVIPAKSFPFLKRKAIAERVCGEFYGKGLPIASEETLPDAFLLQGLLEFGNLRPICTERRLSFYERADGVQ